MAGGDAFHADALAAFDAGTPTQMKVLGEDAHGLININGDVCMHPVFDAVARQRWSQSGFEATDKKTASKSETHLPVKIAQRSIR